MAVAQPHHQHRPPLQSLPEHSQEENSFNFNDSTTTDTHTSNVSDTSDPSATPTTPTPSSSLPLHTSSTSSSNNTTPTYPINILPEQTSAEEETSLLLLSRSRAPSLVVRDRAFSNLSTASSASSSSPVRRKPLPLNASPLATRYSSAERLILPLAPSEEALDRSSSVDSPTVYGIPLTYLPKSSSRNSSSKRLSSEQPAWTTERTFKPLPLDPIPNPQTNHAFSSSRLAAPSQTSRSVTPSEKDERLDSSSTVTYSPYSTSHWDSDSRATTPLHSTMSIFSSKATPPHQINAPTRSFSNDSNDSNTTVQKPLKSPSASKLGSFFGWGGGAASPPSSNTTFSEKTVSSIPSSNSSQDNLPLPHASRTNPARPVPTAIDIPKANAQIGGYFGTAHLQVPLATPTTPLQVEEMEKELKDISAELAASIRRELDLEDLVERLQSEAQNPSGQGRRTSDYFSDSGTSSVRYGSDADPRQDELDRMIRKTEQEKARMKLELTDKIQDERQRRKHFENEVRKLEQKASQVDLASINSLDATGRLRDLESTCEDLRRRLAEERQVKDNFEDLLTALKSELQSSHNERDNLRDEIVPQLRARVEGLEAQATEHEKLTYEQSKVQQELQSLKNENLSLVNAQQMKKFNTISEESGPLPDRRSLGLSRSSSVAGYGVAPRSRPPSLGRSASVKVTESRDALAERVKDVEEQRDALHRALKSLLERQEHQNRENQKKIRHLETERDRALSNNSGRARYDKEVANLREEINVLRRRAEEAMEQKWQCEKGLSGLKMDLDRAEEEISSLRTLLQANDILVPFERRPSTGSRPGSSHASSESLERAYKDLQKAYKESLSRIKSMETAGPRDEDTLRAVQELEQSLADAISERGFAQKEADSLRGQSDSLRKSEKNHLGEEMRLADELRSSAKRVEDLAAQVRQQLASNSTLRQRLSETIDRGEKDQKSNADKIMHMQNRLKSLEDKLVIAQQASEEKISHHEDELKNLRESHNLQLQRMKDGLKSPRAFGPKSPMTPLFANSGKAPRISSTSSGRAMTVSQDSKMEFLKQRVVELETALADADKEMEEVVGRMNIAQIEVMELQNEREAAVRETRRLQKAVEEERVRAFEGRFATLSS